MMFDNHTPREQADAAIREAQELKEQPSVIITAVQTTELSHKFIQQLKEEAQRLLDRADSIEKHLKSPWYAGPWTLRSANAKFDDCCEVDCDFHKGFVNVLVESEGADPIKAKQLRNNAWLIAAAPELYEHLKQLCFDYRDFLANEGHDADMSDALVNAEEYMEKLLEKCQ